MTLSDRFKNRESGYLFYGLTPPKHNTETEKIERIAAKQMERLNGVDIDGLVLYDVQDESSRTSVPRPFPYMATLAPDFYSEHYLQGLDVPKIIYKSVGRSSEEVMKGWLNKYSNSGNCCVFVGAPSKDQETNLSLSDAYKLRKQHGAGLTLGGVTIPERHLKKGDEHLRIKDKIEKGCSFFISQCVYNLDSSKNFISDYYYDSIDNNREMVPIIFTLTPCGSLKTLEFMNWLGIDIPKWLKNDLKHSNDILSKSVEFCMSIATELYTYCTAKGIPVGFNIESVAIRKAEIEASIDLLKSVRGMMS